MRGPNLNMEDNDRSDTGSFTHLFDEIRVHLERAIRMMNEKIAAIEAEGDGKVPKPVDGLHGAVQLLLAERERIEKRIDAYASGATTGELDLDAARAEVESRLDRIHAHFGARGIS